MTDTLPGRPRAVKIGIGAAIVFRGHIRIPQWECMERLWRRPLSGSALGRTGGDAALRSQWRAVGFAGTGNRSDRLGGVPVISGWTGASGKCTEVPVGMDP